MNSFTIQHQTRVPDGIGGHKLTWDTYEEVKGYIDMLGGTDINTKQNAITEDSTHILIIPDFAEGITDKMRVVDKDNRYYTITYSDDPMGQGHHNEIYIKFGGVL